MNILLTGRAGYIGSHAVKGLNRARYVILCPGNFVREHKWVTRENFAEFGIMARQVSWVGNRNIFSLKPLWKLLKTAIKYSMNNNYK